MRDSTGRQAPGDITIRWDGKDLMGTCYRW